MPANTVNTGGPTSFPESFENKVYKLEDEVISLPHKMRSGIKHKVDETVDQLLVCIENPRNEIDNPIHYCTQPFYTIVSTFVASSIIYVASSAMENLFKEYQKPGSASLWNVFIRSTARLKDTIQTNLNIPTGAWEWYKSGEIPMAEYYVLAYLKGSMTIETSIQLSGVDEMGFIQMVQEKAIERDLPVFRAYLRGEKVENRLPFSEQKSLKFKDLMAKEIE